MPGLKTGTRSLEPEGLGSNLSLPLNSGVTLGKSHNLSVPHFPHRQNGDNNNTYL